MTDPDQLPAPFPPNESGSTPCIVRWMVTLKGGLWLGAYDKESFDSYAITAREAERARADALEEALLDTCERMERARGILTDNNPKSDRNWAMLDTTAARALLNQKD